MGLVMEEENYKQLYRAKSPTPIKPAVYDETIPNNATNVVQSKAGAVHTSKIAYYLLFASAKRETCQFILAAVEDTWVCKLREPSTLPWHRPKSSTTCKLYATASISLMCLNCKTKFNISVWTWRESPITSTRLRICRNNPREQVTP